MRFQFIHEPSAKAANLLRCAYRQKYDLYKTLGGKGSEYATADHVGLLALFLIYDNYGFVHAVHYQLDNVVTRHTCQAF